ncbi:hypothetical protein K1719_014812 [Acacia pycnantha]|nr:hypothetical protein K1719_014812 [Acacia pycnantha]
MHGMFCIFGAYLTIQPWSLDFESCASAISKVVVWVRLPGLSFRYYHKSTLRLIGALLGEVVKIDYKTESRGRGKYARMAVTIDLQKALVPSIKVNGKSYRVEYEGLPHICFSCGRYGHSKERCGVTSNSQGRITNQEPSPTVTMETSSGEDRLAVDVASPESLPSRYGEWMQVKYRKKGKKQISGDVEKEKLVRQERKGSCANTSLIKRIRKLLERDWQVAWHHVYREGNRGADLLASWAVTQGRGIHRLSSPPEGLMRFLKEDADGVGLSRLGLSTS